MNAEAPFRTHPNPLAGQDNYQFIEFIGDTERQQCCVVRAHYVVPRITNHYWMDVAIKCYPRRLCLQNSFRRRIKRELFALMACNSHYVTSLYEVFLSGSHLCIVMEYLDGGALVTMIRNFEGGMDEPRAKYFYARILLAVRDMHLAGIKHRDIKAQNIVCSSNSSEVKVCDFDFAKTVTSECKTRLGTLAYMAPEVLSLSYYTNDNEPYDGQKVDIWALDVLLYFMLFNRFPFAIENHSETMESTLHRLKLVVLSTDYIIDNTISEQCQDILNRMLQKQPEHRATANELLSHPWIQRYIEVSGLNTGLRNHSTCYQDESHIVDILNRAVIHGSLEVTDCT